MNQQLAVDTWSLGTLKRLTDGFAYQLIQKQTEKLKSQHYFRDEE